MKRVLVVGGYGTFGAHVCRELAARGVPLTVAGRDGARAQTFAHSLGKDCRGVALNVTQAEACRAAVRGHGVAVNCAGPFQGFDLNLVEACLADGCHYADIADDRNYVALVRAQGERFQERGLAAVYGCSSLPGISGALALLARAGTTAAVKRARLTLFIGNRNPKGPAAVRSLLAALGRPIAAPQGILRGFHDREIVNLPPPFGSQPVFNFDSPEYDLFHGLLGAGAVTVKLGFELRPATYLFATLARFGAGYGSFLADLLEVPGRLLSRFGSSGAAIMTELFFADRAVRRAALVGRTEGQRMAAMPCALAAQALSAEALPGRGALTAYEYLGAEGLLEGLVTAGFSLIHSAAAADIRSAT